MTSFPVKFKASDTGSIARRAEDKLGEVVSVKDFGATGNGTTDDHAAIVAGLNAVKGTGRTLFFPGGVYRVTADVVVTDGDFSVRGDGRYRSLLKPDAGFGNYVLHVSGAADGILENVTVQDIGVDGSNRPWDHRDDPGVVIFAAVRFDYCKNFYVRGFYSDGAHDCLITSHSEQFQFTDLHVKNNSAACVTLFSEAKKGLIRGVLGENVTEVIDFYNNEDIDVSDVVAYADTNSDDETFDISASRRIKISNAVSYGFYRGLYVKAEFGVAWSDIQVDNCQFHEFRFLGINIQSPGTTGDRSRVSGCIVKSSVASTTGIFNSASGTGHIIEGCTVDVPGFGIDTLATGIVVRDNRVSAGTNYGIRVQSATDATIEGNSVSNTGGTNVSAIYVNNCTDPTIRNNRVTNAPSYSGIEVRNNRRPVVTGNRVVSSNLYGIHLVWTATTYVDATNSIVGAVCDNNEVRKWGQGFTVRGGIRVEFSTLTGTYNAVSISGNRLILDNDATLNSQVGIQLILGTLTGVDYFKVDNNLIYRVPTPTSMTLGTNSTSLNNTTKT